MLSRSAPFALLAVLVLPVTGNAPVTLKYKVSQHFSQTIDLTMMGQEAQTNTADYDSYVTVVSSDSAGGHAVTVTVDSIISAPGSNPQIVEALTSQLKGATGSGYVNGSGDASGFATSVQGGALKVLAQAVYPKVKQGAKPGDTWADTASTVDSAMGGSVTRHVITNYSSAAGDSWKGQPTMKLQAASSFTLSGSQGGASLEGNGSNKASFMVARAGHTVSGQNSGKVNLNATTPQAPMPIPLVNETSTTITLLP